MAEFEQSLYQMEIKEKYRNEWVAVKVVERDSSGQPLKAKVICHNPLDRFKLRSDRSKEKEIGIFYTGAVPMEGYVAMF